MNDEDFDNIPLLDELIEKGSASEALQNVNLEQKINSILQRHTTQAVAEIIAIIDADKNNNR